MAIDVDALNYPYIRVRNVDWLKRTLLVFPHVVRMTPLRNAPLDDPAVEEFCYTQGRRGPLLRSANLWAPYVHEAQLRIIDDIGSRLFAEGGAAFRERYGRAAALAEPEPELLPTASVWERRLARRGSFQIHSEKLLEELASFLRREGLAWTPTDLPDGYGYVEMHRKLGEAVMAALAFACAENEGLEVVTEFPALHGKTLNQPQSEIFAACLSDKRPPENNPADLALQFLVYRRCDPSKLTAERLQALNQESEALGNFKDAIEAAAKKVPKDIRDPKILESYLNDVSNDVFKAWQADQANQSNFVRMLFGDGALDEPMKLLQKVAEAAATPTATLAAAGGAAGNLVGGLTVGALAGAAAGFAIGLMSYGLKTAVDLGKREKTSPFRYLTLLEENGVGFTVGT